MSVLVRPQARLSDDPDILHAIRDDECNLAIWQRDAAPSVQSLLGDSVRDVRFTHGLQGFGARFAAELDDHGFVRSPQRDAFVNDVCELGSLYCEILSLESLELRLEVVTTDSCRKFHADYVRARLITTYVGAGTDWIDGEDAERLANGLAPRVVHSLGTGDVGIFEGKLATPHPAIHRSPPIGETGAKRLLLVLNPPEER